MIRVLVVAAAAVTATWVGGARPCGATEAPTPSVAVTTAPIAHEEMRDQLRGFGTITLGEGATSDVSFQHAGQVVRLDAQPGQMVVAGQPLASVTTDPAAALSYRNAVAAEGFAERDLARTRTLLAQHLATNAQVAVARKAVVDAQAALSAERALGNDKATETAVAPAEGFVSQVAANVGDRIAAGAVVLKVSRVDRPPRVTLGLEPDAARRLAAGMPARATPVYGDQATSYGGRVVGTSGTLDPATHLVDAWVELDGPGGVLAVGTGVKVTVTLSEHEATVVPRDAVLRDGRGDYVFAVEGGVARRVDVRTGGQTDEVTEIVGPLPPDMRVVTVGDYELRDGMAVREAAPPTRAPSPPRT